MARTSNLKTAVGLMAKAPESGQVKTRLALAIGDEGALDVYKRLLTRAACLVIDLPSERYLRTVHVTPDWSLDWFADFYAGFDAVIPQSAGHLGQRMQHALRHLLKRDDTNRAILIGTDIPEIDKETIDSAASALKSNDLVIGPTTDGGYYLIGLKRIYARLFEGIDWGTETVLATSIERAGSLGLRVSKLPVLRDLDDVDDLNHFRIGRVFT